MAVGLDLLAPLVGAPDDVARVERRRPRAAWTRARARSSAAVVAWRAPQAAANAASCRALRERTPSAWRGGGQRAQARAAGAYPRASQRAGEAGGGDLVDPAGHARGAGEAGARALGLLRDARRVLAGAGLERPGEVAESCLRGAADALLSLPGAPVVVGLRSAAEALLEAVEVGFAPAGPAAAAAAADAGPAL